MSPHRQLSYSSRRHPTQIQETFVGLALQLHDRPPPSSDNAQSEKGSTNAQVRDMEYSIVLHDGTGVTESETYHHPYAGRLEEAETLSAAARTLTEEILGRISEIQKTKSMDVRIIAAAEPIPEEVRVVRGIEWMATVWLHLDAIPFVISPATTMFDRLPAPSTQASATSAVSGALKYLHPATHSATVADTDPHDHAVLVDCDRKVQLGSLTQYRQSTTPELWKRFESLSKLLIDTHTKIAFFSATPQGGGVALMRHALIRLWRLVGLDVKWYVPEGHPAIFDITKRKIHNVLQGVAPEGTEMSETDKRWFETWTEQNYEAFWSKGALDADLIVIDDPQLTALIPIIKKHRPEAKIIFRSHIQIQSDLTDDPSTPQNRTWNYLYDFIKDSDLFLAHPVKQFVPKNVRQGLPVLYMAPSTDQLDGLNKPYGNTSVAYFRQYFNSLASKQGGNPINWDRGYICQIARFDPSKGIEYLLEAYLQFRQKLEQMDNPPEDGGPQLIIMGHGSVDDPDGTVILEKCFDIISSDEYALVKDDVALVRAAPSDSILGCILQGAWVATQLSTREGFEVKVTEAIYKRVPIIASDAGGIPLQVKHGLNGWIVPSADSRAVSDLLYDIYTGKASVSRRVEGDEQLDGRSDPNSSAEAFVREPQQKVRAVHDPQDEGSTSEDFWTVGNAAKWMLLAARVLGLGLEVPHRQADADAEAGGAVEGQNGPVKLSMDVEALREMGVGEGTKGWEKGGKEEGDNVWKLVMRRDLVEGEGEIRDRQ